MNSAPIHAYRARQNPRHRHVWMLETLSKLPNGQDKVEIIAIYGSKHGADADAAAFNAALPKQVEA